MQQKTPEVLPPAMLMMIRILLVRKNRQADTLQDVQDYGSTMILGNYPRFARFQQQFIANACRRLRHLNVKLVITAFLADGLWVIQVSKLVT